MDRSSPRTAASRPARAGPGPGSGATPAAARHFDAGVTAFQTWRPGADAALVQALHEAPRFTMAHVLRGYLLVCGRDLRRIRSAASLLPGTAGLATDRRERLHLEALAAAAAGDPAQAARSLDAVLADWPDDALALQVASTFDYLTGELRRMLDRVRAVRPAWSPATPGRQALLTTHAFALEENGAYDQAEAVAREALALDPFDMRAHHVMAHVFEMTDRPAEGLRWMHERAAGGLTVHCWWHVALFHLCRSGVDQALAVYDRVLRPGTACDVADLIDAAALLWRIRLRGGEVGTRAQVLAAAWAPRIADRFCTFSDVHAMMAFVAAGDWSRADRLLQVLADARSPSTRHGRTSGELGLPACRALLAFGHGDYELATRLLGGLPSVAHRLGGSHAQRDALHLTLLEAVQRLRRPVRPPGRHRVAAPRDGAPRADAVTLGA